MKLGGGPSIRWLHVIGKKWGKTVLVLVFDNTCTCNVTTTFFVAQFEHVGSSLWDVMAMAHSRGRWSAKLCWGGANGRDTLQPNKDGRQQQLNCSLFSTSVVKTWTCKFGRATYF